MTTEILDRSAIERMLPASGPRWSAAATARSTVIAIRCACSARCIRRCGGSARATCRAIASRHIRRCRRRLQRCRRPAARCAAGKVVLAAGNASRELAPMVGLRAPMRPEARPDHRHGAAAAVPAASRGHRPADRRRHRHDRRQQARGHQPRWHDHARQRGDGRPRRAHVSGCSAPQRRAHVERHSRHDPGRLPDLRPVGGRTRARSSSCCHSGVTLAANHALTLAPMIAAGELDRGHGRRLSARGGSMFRALPDMAGARVCRSTVDGERLCGARGRYGGRGAAGRRDRPLPDDPGHRARRARPTA